jgi:hypothetical protein
MKAREMANTLFGWLVLSGGCASIAAGTLHAVGAPFPPAGTGRYRINRRLFGLAFVCQGVSLVVGAIPRLAGPLGPAATANAHLSGVDLVLNLATITLFILAFAVDRTNGRPSAAGTVDR